MVSGAIGSGITNGLRRIAVPLNRAAAAVQAPGVWPRGLKIGRGIAAQPHLGPQKPSKEGTANWGAPVASISSAAAPSQAPFSGRSTCRIFDGKRLVSD